MLKIKEPLSDTPSKLIRQAVADARIVAKDSRYTLNMDTWHRANDETCHVCLGGSVIARRTNAHHRSTLNPDVYIWIFDKLHALNNFRVGDVQEGLSDLGIKQVWANRLMPDPGIGDEHEGLFVALLRLADDFEKRGI